MSQDTLEYDGESDYEFEMSVIESDSKSLIESSQLLMAAAEELLNAAQVGNLSLLRRAVSELPNIITNISSNLERLQQIDVERFVRLIGSRRFLDQILKIAQSRGIYTINPSRGEVVCFPTKLLIEPGVVKNGRKTLSISRPSAIVSYLSKNYVADRPLDDTTVEMFVAAYKSLTDGADSVSVKLQSVYELLTLHPSAKKAYPENEFWRDVAILDAFGPRFTAGGLAVRFPNSTGAKGAYKTITPVGKETSYSSIRFDPIAGDA